MDKSNFPFMKSNKVILLLTSILLAIVFVAIFQDYLESQRNDFDFVFLESLLFKLVWFLFPPMFIFIKMMSVRFKIVHVKQILVIFILSILLHLLLVPLSVWGVSAIFKAQAYGFIKVLSFTLSNDLLKIILVYGVFLVSLKRDMRLKYNEKLSSHVSYQGNNVSESIVVSAGKQSTILKFSDILFVSSATPYVAIQSCNKQYLYSASLKSMLKLLDERFVRIHRSHIVNVNRVVSYHSRLNGDYDLTLDNQSQLRLSRNYVMNFKRYFSTIPQVKS